MDLLNTIFVSKDLSWNRSNLILTWVKKETCIARIFPWGRGEQFSLSDFYLNIDLFNKIQHLLLKKHYYRRTMPKNEHFGPVKISIVIYITVSSCPFKVTIKTLKNVDGYRIIIYNHVTQ